MLDRTKSPLQVRWEKAKARAQSLLKWDESEHPREPAGGPGGGQFTSGGGGSGGEASKPSASGGKGKGKKVKLEDFQKEAVQVEGADTKSQQDKFVKVWEERVGEAPGEFKKDFMGGLEGTMTIGFKDHPDNPTGGEMEIQGLIYSEDGTRTIGEYNREINLTTGKAYSAFFKIKRGETGHDVGKKMLAANVAMYKQLGVKQVDVFANIDVGGYAWAKYGYVPTRNDWEDLRDNLKDELGSGSGGGGGTDTIHPDEWDMMSGWQQEDIKRAWMRATEHEFMRSEEEHWRDNGGALDEAKSQLVSQFTGAPHNNPGAYDWATDAIDKYKEGTDVPYTTKQLLAAINLDYQSDGEGRNDLEVEFDDAFLKEPENFPPPEQGNLPGIEPQKPEDRLTEKMRDGLTNALDKAFEKEADDLSGRMEAPDYLHDQVAEFQSEHWSGMSDRERFRWAEQNNELPEIEIERDEEDQPELDVGENADLIQLLNSSNPKAIWAVADHPKGKDLLLGKSWHGTLDLNDKQSMERFNAYVGKKKKG